MPVVRLQIVWRTVIAWCAVLALALPAAAEQRDGRWIATWAPALMERPVPVAGRGGPGGGMQGRGAGPAGAGQATPGRRGGGPPPPVTFNNQTLRQILRVSLGGERIRLVLSNAFGTAPLRIGAAHVALRACPTRAAGCERTSDTAIEGTPRPLTVDGRRAFVVPRRAVLVTDPVDLDVPSLAELVVDLYLPDDLSANTVPLTYHASAMQTNYLSTPGNHAGSEAFPVDRPVNNWFFLARVEVVGPADAGVIVALGDSITDGAGSTAGENRRWPDVLAERLVRRGGRPFAVVNAGISGNRLLASGSGESALARLDRDVLLQPGVTHLIVLEGINDIGAAREAPEPSAADLILAHRQIIARAKARGINVIGATLAPFEGAFYFTAEGEARRQALNEWIRTSGEYDAVIDFDRITRDPDHPARFLPLHDSGDRLHPGDAGYAAMGNGIDLALFD